MNNGRRSFLKQWMTPAVIVAVLPKHAQATHLISECSSQPFNVESSIIHCDANSTPGKLVVRLCNTEPEAINVIYAYDDGFESIIPNLPFTLDAGGCIDIELVAKDSVQLECLGPDSSAAFVCEFESASH